MNEEAIDRIVDALEPLAEKLGQGAEAAFELSVRQVIIEGVAFIVIGLLLFGLCGVGVWAIKWSRKKWLEAQDTKKDRYSYSDGEGYAICGGLSALATLGAVIAGLSLFYSGAMRLANPHFAALERILEAVR